MWGAMVARAGVGPTPCPVGDLTDDLLAEKFKELTSPDIKAKAEQMADNMNKEDGIQGGLDHFLDDLPRDNMLCDVSLLLGEAKVAKYDVWGRHMYRVVLTPESGLKVSTECKAVLESWGYGVERDVHSMEYLRRWWSNTTQVGGLSFRRHGITMYALGRVRDFKGGCLSSICGCLRHFGLATIQMCYRSDGEDAHLVVDVLYLRLHGISLAADQLCIRLFTDITFSDYFILLQLAPQLGLAIMG